MSLQYLTPAGFAWPMVVVFLFLAEVDGLAQTMIPLYETEIPNSIPSPDREVTEGGRVRNITKPSLTIFLPPPEKQNGCAVVVCPGGGYTINAIQHEGFDVARKLNEMGITAFVLKYRVPDDNTMTKKELGPLQDAQQALRIVRQRAKEWGIDIHRVGILGFSAGGHLAASAGTHRDSLKHDDAKRINVRPDFMILIYPVISFRDDICHRGSRQRLLGEDPTDEKIRQFSNELRITGETPPAFLVHASDDKAVVPENSIVFYQQLLIHGVNAELHLYQAGGHGFGLNNPTTSDQWIDRCQSWLRSNQWIK